MRHRDDVRDVNSDRLMTFHGLRHTYAVKKYWELTGSGMSALDAHFAVSQLSGHEWADMTNIYLASVRKGSAISSDYRSFDGLPPDPPGGGLEPILSIGRNTAYELVPSGKIVSAYEYLKFLLTEIPKHMDDYGLTFLEDLMPLSRPYRTNTENLLNQDRRSLTGGFRFFIAYLQSSVYQQTESKSTFSTD
ncbi:Uncharacterised protein [uncultured Blautia sp.]|nr:Uncharacterised protein [uncultured Blautia sp.]